MPHHPEHARTERHALISYDHGALQPLPKPVDVAAGRPQAGQLDDCTCSEMQATCQREPEKIEMPRRNVLAELAGLHHETERL
jgi:hypothetical protein